MRGKGKNKRMRRKPSKVSNKNFATILIVVFSLLIMIGGASLLFFIPKRNDTAVNASDQGSIPEKQSGENEGTISDEEKYISDLLKDIEIELTIGKNKELLSYDQIKPWITVGQDSGGGKCIADKQSLDSYAAHLADKYNNFEGYIKFRTKSGEELTLENHSTGWLLDTEYTASRLRELIEKGESASIDLTDRSESSNKWWTRVSGDYSAADEKGDCYAEVSIEQQYMWMFKGGKVILESPVVTGDPGNGNDTPKGAFSVYNKASPATLYGPGYITEVSYWVGFFDSIGFHDASWQDEFGGKVYLENGSHGCVNLPVDFAAKLYEAAYVNMPVYVY